MTLVRQRVTPATVKTLPFIPYREIVYREKSTVGNPQNLAQGTVGNPLNLEKRNKEEINGERAGICTNQSMVARAGGHTTEDPGSPA